MSMKTSAACLSRFLIALTAMMVLGAPLCSQSADDDSRALRPIEVIEKRALLIGNADYLGTSRLRNTISDVNALEEVLITLGFEVMTAQDLTLEAMKATVREFAVELSPGDLGLFYYSGHGVQVENENYLLPVDFQSGTLRSEVADEAYSASRVMRMLKDKGARVRVMVLDACRNNPFLDDRSTNRGLSPMHASGEGSLVVFTTGEGDVASDNASGDLGLYMTHLLPELRRETVELKEAFERTRAAVYHAAIQRGETQRPAHYEDLIGKVFIRGSSPLDTAASTLEPLISAGSGGEQVASPGTPAEVRPLPLDLQGGQQPITADLVREEISEAIRAATFEEREAIDKVETVINKYRDLPIAQPMIALLTEKLESSRVRIEAKWRWHDIRKSGSQRAVLEFINKYRDEPSASDFLEAAEQRWRELEGSMTAASRWNEIDDWPQFKSQNQYMEDLRGHRESIQDYIERYGNDPTAVELTELARERLDDIESLELASIALDAVLRADTVDALETYLAYHSSLPGSQSLADRARARLDLLQLPTRAAEQWEAIKNTTSRATLEEFIDEFDDDARITSLVTLARERLNRLDAIQMQEEARLALDEVRESGNPEDLLALIERYSDEPTLEDSVRPAIARWNALPVLVRAEARWARVEGASDVDAIQAYVDEFQDHPDAAEWVSMARVQLEHWKYYAPIKAAINAVEFVRIPPGQFRMGSAAHGEPDERPETEVTISQAFMLAKFETTQRTWVAVMGNNPSEFIECGLDCPVDSVSWDDVQEFVSKLNQMEGYDKYGIPTEAEWEYAARAGSTVEPRLRSLDAIAWHRENSGIRTRMVGLKAANQIGLHDMLGNVWEWVRDWSGRYPGDEVTDPTGPQSGSYKVSRGGSWITLPGQCRMANRNPLYPDQRTSTMGFRLLKRISVQ